MLLDLWIQMTFSSGIGQHGTKPVRVILIKLICQLVRDPKMSCCDLL